MQVDLSDKKIFDLVQRSDNRTTQKSKNSESSQYSIEEDNKEEPVIIVKVCKQNGSLQDFIKKIFLIVFILLILYFTIFRYVLGYNFFKNKEYKKGAAVLSPELITISSLLLL